jgi:hypothetical protein
MLDISISKIVVNATSHSLSMVSLTCRPITCVTAHVSLHIGDEYCRSSVGPYLFDSLPEELGNLITSEVNYLSLVCFIYRDGHVIWLIQPFGL